ncbi:MAG: hypothetical protein EGR71_10450 [Clostridiales bacterium]|nr:hypothetical protein [Clostridiales bacterium]
MLSKEYKISGIFITILVMAATFIIFHNEDISVRLFATALFTVAALITCFLGTRVSVRIIKTGDRIKNKLVKVLYYIGLPIALICLTGLVWVVMAVVNGKLVNTDNIGTSFGQSYMLAIVAIAVCIFAIVPYIQTIIVLGLRKFKKFN